MINSRIQYLQEAYFNYLLENPFTGSPQNLYEPMNYILSLGGKRIRPLLSLIGNQSANGDEKIALPIAHLVEVFHNFSLVHDDIMDRADVRRGKPTVHVKWDIPTAILSGDNLLVKTFEIWHQYSGPNKDEILSCYIKTYYVHITICIGMGVIIYLLSLLSPFASILGDSILQNSSTPSK